MPRAQRAATPNTATRPPPTRGGRVGTAGFECNGLHAGPLFFPHLTARIGTYRQLQALMDRQTLWQTKATNAPSQTPFAQWERRRGQECTGDAAARFGSTQSGRTKWQV